jgi:hypothetical protein
VCYETDVTLPKQHGVCSAVSTFLDIINKTKILIFGRLEIIGERMEKKSHLSVT